MVADLDMRVGALDVLLGLTDAVIVSLELALALTGADRAELALRRLANDTRAPLVAVTLGGEGCVATVRDMEDKVQRSASLVRLPAYAVVRL